MATVEKRHARAAFSPGNSPKKPITKKSRTVKAVSKTKRPAKAPVFEGHAQDLELEIRRLEAEKELEVQKEKSARAQIELLKLKMNMGKGEDDVE